MRRQGRPGRGARRNAAAALAALGAALLLTWAALAVRSGSDDRTPRPIAHGPRDASSAPHDPTPEDRTGAEILTTPPVETADPGWPEVRAGEHEIAGRVRSRGAGPIAGAIVRIVLSVGGEERELGSATTDAAGRYLLATHAVAELSEYRRGTCRVLIDARAPGHRPRRISRALDPAVPRLVLDLVLEPGGVLAGRVVDRAGKPVPGATVALVVESALPGKAELFAADEDETDARGRYELGFVSGGIYQVQARADGIGSARALEVELEPEVDRVLADLVLQGSGTLAGQVRYQDGSPARGLEICAVPPELAGKRNAVPIAARGAVLHERGDGLTTGRTTTDAEGRFAFEGLREGTFALVASRPSTELEPGATGFATGAMDLALTALVHRVRVKVTGLDGQPLRGATVTATEMRPDRDGALRPGPAQHTAARGADAACDFDVPPDVPIGIRAMARGCHPSEEIVLIRSGEHELERTLVLLPASRGGRIRIDVRGPSGERVAPAFASVLSAATSLPVPGFDGALLGDDGVLGLLPPGRYVVKVRGPDADTYFPSRSSSEIEVLEGAEAWVAIDLRRGGRLRLTLAVPPGSEIQEAPGWEAYGEQTRRRRAARALRELGASATLVADDGSGDGVARGVGEIALQFATDFGLEPQLLPGTSGLADDLIAPGTYTLRVRAPRFATAERTIVIEAGRIADVEVSLQPE